MCWHVDVATTRLEFTERTLLSFLNPLPHSKPKTLQTILLNLSELCAPITTTTKHCRLLVMMMMMIMLNYGTDAGRTDAAAPEANCSSVTHVMQVQFQVSCKCSQHYEWVSMTVSIIIVIVIVCGHGVHPPGRWVLSVDELLLVGDYMVEPGWKQ